MESRSGRIIRFGEMHMRARNISGKSREYMSMELGVSKKTIQNWENGLSSPSFFQSLEWFHVLNINPFPFYVSFLYPDKIPMQKSDYTDEEVNDAFASLIENLSVADKRAWLFLYYGPHGSSPKSILQLIIAHLHLPIESRIINALQVVGIYELHKQLGSTICNSSIEPDIENLKSALNKARQSAMQKDQGYVNIYGGNENDEKPHE